ncbi:MAG: BatA domain-containing protein [Fuerstiella sp.]
MSWLSQFFLNPAFVVPGAALASVPIIIHLLSRLRYKKVRFAAMEFLLQSDEMNRRRLIFEQLLLLLLRVLAVVLIVLLLSRLVLDPSRMMLLRGARTHHVLIIDDSLSMREQVDEQTVFGQAILTLERMLTQAGTTAGSLQCTVLTTSDPERPLVTDRPLNNALVQELNPRLSNLSPSWKAVDPQAALTAAYNILSGDGGVSPQVHVFTDLRASDWNDQPELAAAIEQLDAIDAQINLIQVTQDRADNVALEKLDAATLATAVGVPWRMDLTFHNHSDSRATGLRADVLVDGSVLPVRALVPDIEPGEQVQQSHDILFDSPGVHEVQVRLQQDALVEDNSRFLVVDVADKRSVLIVDDSGQQEDAGYVAAALGADHMAIEIRQSDVLVSEVLDRFDCIYLLNVRELPADATLLLTKYVEQGGGIAWFPDDQANTTWYNTALMSTTTPLFPVRLGAVQSIPETAAGQDPQFQQLIFEPHPVFDFFADTPLADEIRIARWFGVAAANPDGESDSDSTPDLPASIDRAQVVGRLTNGSPVIFDHQVGEGRVLTFLTTAGRRWSNWPVLPAAPGFVVMHLLMHQYLQQPADSVQIRELGAPIRFAWPVSEYLETVEVFLPDSEDEAATGFLRLQATPDATDGEKSESDAAVAAELETTDAAQSSDNEAAPSDTVAAAANVAQDAVLSVSLPQADRPGAYRIRRFRPTGEAEETWLALSVANGESDLALADPASVQAISENGSIEVVAADVATELSTSDAGREIRWLLIGLLLAVLVAEQLLSLRMSYHPETQS